MRKFIRALLTAAILFAGVHTHAAFIGNETGERWNIGGGYNLPTTTGTIAIWVYPNWAQTDSTHHGFIGHDTNSVTCGANQFGLFKYSDNAMWFGWFVGSVDYRITVSSGSYTLNQSQWNLLAGTWNDTANETFLYLNGTQIGSNTSALQTYSTGGLQIGSNRCSTFQSDPNAGLGELGIWSRVLSSGELGALAKKYSALFVNNGLEFYVPGIRQDAGTTTMDFNSKIRQAFGNGIVLQGNAGFTNTLQAHPPIFYPRGMK